MKINLNNINHDDYYKLDFAQKTQYVLLVYKKHSKKLEEVRKKTNLSWITYKEDGGILDKGMNEEPSTKELYKQSNELGYPIFVHLAPITTGDIIIETNDLRYHDNYPQPVKGDTYVSFRERVESYVQEKKFSIIGLTNHHWGFYGLGEKDQPCRHNLIPIK